MLVLMAIFSNLRPKWGSGCTTFSPVGCIPLCALSPHYKQLKERCWHSKKPPWTVSTYYQMNPQYSFHPEEKGRIELIFCPIPFFFISHIPDLYDRRVLCMLKRWAHHPLWQRSRLLVGWVNSSCLTVWNSILWGVKQLDFIYLIISPKLLLKHKVKLLYANLAL